MGTYVYVHHDGSHYGKGNSSFEAIVNALGRETAHKMTFRDPRWESSEEIIDMPGQETEHAARKSELIVEDESGNEILIGNLYDVFSASKIKIKRTASGWNCDLLPGRFFESKEKLIVSAKCPGGKIRSRGLGRGKGYGKGKGPIGIPFGKKKKKKQKKD